MRDVAEGGDFVGSGDDDGARSLRLYAEVAGQGFSAVAGRKGVERG